MIERTTDIAGGCEMSERRGSRRWGIVTLLVLDYIVMFLARSTMSMSGPSLMEEFSWTATQFGWVQTAFFIGYAITQMPAGALADKLGAGRVLVIGSIWYALFTYLTSFTSALSIMMLVRIFVGIGQGVVVPSDFSMLSRWVPQKEAGLAGGIVQFGCPFGIGASMIVTVACIQAFGWKSSFYVFSVLPVIWCFLWWKFGCDTPEQDKQISKAELDYIHSGQAAASQDKASAELAAAPVLTKVDILRTPSVWCIALSYFCTNYVFFLFMTWLPSYFSLGRGIDLKSSAIYSMLPYFVALFAYPIGGWLADVFSRKFGSNWGRRICIIGGLLLAGGFLMMASKAGDVITAVALISISNGFVCLTMGSFFSIPVVFSQKNTGMIVGLNGFFGTASGIVAPILSGFIIDLVGNYDTALYVGACIALFGAVLNSLAKVKPIQPKAGH